MVDKLFDPPSFLALVLKVWEPSVSTCVPGAGFWPYCFESETQELHTCRSEGSGLHIKIPQAGIIKL